MLQNHGVTIIAAYVLSSTISFQKLKPDCKLTHTTCYKLQFTDHVVTLDTHIEGMAAESFQHGLLSLFSALHSRTHLPKVPLP